MGDLPTLYGKHARMMHGTPDTKRACVEHIQIFLTILDFK